MSSNTTYKSYRPQVKKLVDKCLKDGMQRAMRYAQVKCDELVSRGQNVPTSSGEPPRVLTGVLRSSIDVETTIEQGDAVGWLGVRTSPAKKPKPDPAAKKLKKKADNAEGYALGLELGTSRTPPHPYLVPTIRKHKKEITTRMGSEFKKRWNNATRGSK